MMNQFSLLATFVLLGIAVTYPWVRSRIGLTESIETLSLHQLRSSAEEFAETGANFLRRFEIISSYLASLSDDPVLMRCDKEHISNFIHFCTTVSITAQLQPYSFALSHRKNRKFCELRVNVQDSSKFTLLYLVSDTEMRIYDETVDFGNWDPQNDGEVFDVSSKYQNIFSDSSDLSKSSWGDASLFDDMQPRLGIFTPIYDASNDLDSVGSVHTYTNRLWNTVKTVETTDYMRYVILNPSGEVIIESTLGVVNQTNATFPTLNELGIDFWTSISEYCCGQNGVQKVMIGEDEFLVITEPMNSMVSKPFRVVMTLNLSQKQHESRRVRLLVIIGMLVLIAIGVVIMRVMFGMNAVKKERKLRNLAITEEIEESGICGSIHRSILKLRNLELSFPDEAAVNKILDGAVINLAVPKDRLFSFPASECACQLCSEMNSVNKQNLSNQSDDTYMLWKKVSILQDIGVFDPLEAAEDPQRYLTRFVAKFIFDNNLMMVEFDPDQLMQFFAVFIARCVKYPEHKAHMLHHVGEFLCGPFKNWIVCRIDLLCVLFVVIVKDFIYENAVEMLDQEAAADIIMRQDVFCDDLSSIRRNAKIVMNIFHQFVPKTNAALMAYFRDTVIDILNELRTNNIFSVVGEFASRIESPEFSIHQNDSDKRLFLKYIILFADLCPYWSEKSVMIKLLDQMKQSIFTEDEANRAFESLWHLEFGQRFVQNMLRILNLFASFETIRSNLSQNLEYWREQSPHV